MTSRLTLRQLKKTSQIKGAAPLVGVTAYDACFAKLADAAQVDVILVGDSVGNTTLGFDSTVPVTLAMMQHHTAAVVRGSQRALVGLDLPFGSYHQKKPDVIADIRSAFQATGCQFVKLEGADKVQLEIVRTLTSMGIPVMGHLGYTPQQSLRSGGPRVSAKTSAETSKLIKDAQALQTAGAVALVLEMVPSTVTRHLTKTLKIPTIGIGSGPHCDGQILVLHDILGLDLDFKPKFAKRYATLGQRALTALKDYAGDVRSGAFPGSDYSPY